MSKLINAFVGYGDIATRDFLCSFFEENHLPIDAHCLNDVHQSIAYLDKHLPNLLFLEMSEHFNAYQVLDTIKPSPCILVSDSPQHAARAFDYQVLDFLSKPLSARRLEMTMARLLPMAEPKQKKLIFKEAGQFHFFDTEDISWIETAGNYVKFHASDNPVLIRTTMKNLMNCLPQDLFLRIRNTTVINKEQIKTVKSLKNSRFLFVLKDGTQLSSSRSYNEPLTQYLHSILSI